MNIYMLVSQENINCACIVLATFLLLSLELALSLHFQFNGCIWDFALQGEDPHGDETQEEAGGKRNDPANHEFSVIISEPRSVC